MSKHLDPIVSATVRRWKTDAVALVRECFRVEPDAWQLEALRLIVKPNCERLAMKACKGPGKTAVIAWIVLWFLATHENARVGCTSITEANIDTALWPELFKWMQKSAFFRAGFVWTSTHVMCRAEPQNWFAVKRTWPKSGDKQQQADALAGLHADNVMFVLDEVGGIPQAVMVTAEAVLATKGSVAKLVISGNPTHTTGPLHRACTIDRTLWNVITITGDPDDPKRSPRISEKWAREQIAAYGRTNPWVMVNVLGEFPPSSINALLGLEEVEKAMRRHLAPDAYNWAQKRIGVDVARFGDDLNAIFPRQGLMSWKPVVMRNQRTTAIAARVARACVKWKCEQVFIDDSGHWGHGVVDQLITGGFPVLPLMFGDPAPNPRFKNLRSYLWMTAAEYVRAGAVLPYVPEMISEWTEPTYTFIGGQFVLEPKEMIKARLGVSPDRTEAYVTTFGMPEMPGDFLIKLRGQARARTEDDVFLTADEREQFGRAVTADNPWQE